MLVKLRLFQSIYKFQAIIWIFFFSQWRFTRIWAISSAKSSATRCRGLLRCVFSIISSSYLFFPPFNSIFSWLQVDMYEFDTSVFSVLFQVDDLLCSRDREDELRWNDVNCWVKGLWTDFTTMKVCRMLEFLKIVCAVWFYDYVHAREIMNARVLGVR